MTDTLQKKIGDYPHYSYDELVTSHGAEIVLDRSDNDYQGDTYYLLRDGDRYGYLVVGWGSCSGCDALEACSTFEDIQQLRDDLVGSITWGTKAEIREHIAARQSGNDFYADDATFKDFQQAALTI